MKAIDHQQNSYIGRIGQTIQPVLAPLGFDWKMSVSLLTGMAAKEVVVSTLSVLYTGNADDDSQALSERLKQDRNAEGNLVFTPLIAISLMLFRLDLFSVHSNYIGYCQRVWLMEMGYIRYHLYLCPSMDRFFHCLSNGKFLCGFILLRTFLCFI